jgi:hypothetical protein
VGSAHTPEQAERLGDLPVLPPVQRVRQDRWVFGDRESGRYLTKFAWTRIVRHQLGIKGASVDDPTLTEYWALRRRRNKPPLSPLLLRLQRQHGPVPALRKSSPARPACSRRCGPC